MAVITDLPAELQQHIVQLIPGSTPDEVQLSHKGWPGPVKQLLATCKILRADTFRLMSTWSFECLISRSDDIKLLEDDLKNEDEPEKDFSTLRPLHLSKYSATAYYNNSLDDEEAARKVVIKHLALVVDCRQCLNKMPYLDFLPVPRPRYKLVRELSRGQGLVCRSIDGRYGMFHRISSLVDEIASRLNRITGRDLEQPMESLSMSHAVDSIAEDQ